jgi:hypothetical protein
MHFTTESTEKEEKSKIKKDQRKNVNGKGTARERSEASVFSVPPW